MSRVPGRVASITIDGSALQHNLARVRAFAPQSRIMAVIKANAYGHGLLTAANYLADADAFALAMVEEAVILREAGISKPLVVLQGFNDDRELALLGQHDIETVIHHSTQLERLERSSVENLKVWLKIDTGMHRLGFAVADVQDVVQRLKACNNVCSIALMSHLANADEPEHALNLIQLKNFSQLTQNLSLECSLANSAALIAHEQTRMDWVRPGIMLYGSSPLNNRTAQQLQLKPAMQFESQLVAINAMRQGDAIGYGSTWQCPEDMPVGVVAAGYGDGYPRHAASGTPVWLNGVQCPLVGRVSMDSICIDLRPVEARVGDRVVLWGNELSVDTVAQTAATISYEILCTAGNAVGTN